MPGGGRGLSICSPAATTCLSRAGSSEAACHCWETLPSGARGRVGPGAGLGCSCSGASPPKRGLQAFASSLPSGVLPKAFKRGASLSPHPHLPEQRQGCSIQGETKTPQKPWSQALLCAQAVSSGLSVCEHMSMLRGRTCGHSTWAHGNIRAQGDTGVSAGSYISASAYGHRGP